MELSNVTLHVTPLGSKIYSFFEKLEFHLPNNFKEWVAAIQKNEMWFTTQDPDIKFKCNDRITVI